MIQLTNYTANLTKNKTSEDYSKSESIQGNFKYKFEDGKRKGCCSLPKIQNITYTLSG